MKAASYSAERSNQATEQVGATIDRKKETRSQNPTWQAFSLGVQAKLSVSSPDDPSEHEADRVADQVTRTSNAASPLYQRVAIQTKPLGVPNIQRLCGACESHKDEEELHLHRKADDGYIGSTLSDVHTVVNTPGVGASLSDNLRQRIEPVLGADLSSVRVHSDARSQSAATEIGAKAFTHQNNIYLGRGQDSNDLGLMAHESTHVVQQGFAGASALQRKPTDAHIIQRETDGSVWDRIGSAVSSGGETLLDYGSRGVTAVGEGVGAVVDAGGAVVSTGLGMARDAIVGLVESYAPGAVAFFSNLTNYVKQRAAAGFNTLFGGLPGRIAEGGLAGALEFIFVDLIGGVWQGIGSAVGASCSAMGAVANVLMDIGNRLGAEAVAVVQQGASSVADFLSGLWEQYGVPATEAISSFASGIWEDISTTVSGWWDALAPIREAASEAWDWVVSTFMEGSSMVNQFLTGIFQKLVEEWDALKEKLRPYMTYVQIAIGVLLLMSPMGPFIAAGAVAYGAYRLVSYLWEVIGQPMVASVRQFIADTIMPQIDSAIVGLQEAIVGAKQWLSNLVDRLAAVGTGLLGAIGALPLINMAGQLFASLSEQFQQFANTAKQKIEEFATAARQLFAQFMTFISPVIEFIRQLVLISVFGPLAILDDGVWATMQSVAAFAMTVPCVREMAGLMQLPLIMKGAERFRNMLKSAWEIIQNPQPILDALHNALQPMIESVAGVTSTILASVIYPDEPQHRIGVERHLQPAIQHMLENWWQELLNMGGTLLWPWGEVADKFPQMLDKGAHAIESFFNLEVSQAIDDFLAMMQDVNAILGALWGWFALAAVLIGGVLGALGVEFTAGASIGAGMAAGWAVAEEVGLVLLGAMVATEMGIIGKAMFDIRFNNALIEDPRQRAQANDHDYEHIANSTFSLAVVTALVVLGALAQKFASAIWEFAKATVPGLEAVSEAISERVSSVLDAPRGRGADVVEGDIGGRGTTDADVATDSALPTEDTPILEEPLSEGKAIVDENGVIELCSSPCEPCERILADSDMPPERARNFRERLRVLESAIEDATDAGATPDEIRQRFGESVEELSEQIKAADRGELGDTGSDGNELDGLFDDPRKVDPYERVDAAQTGTAYHEAIEAAVIEALPPDTVFTDRTYPELFEQIGVDPPFRGKSGPDLYVIDWEAQRIRAFDMTRGAEAGNHAVKALNNAEALAESLEGSGWTIEDTVPELPYEGMSQEEAAEAVIREIRGYAVPP